MSYKMPIAMPMEAMHIVMPIAVISNYLLQRSLIAAATNSRNLYIAVFTYSSNYLSAMPAAVTYSSNYLLYRY